MVSKTEPVDRFDQAEALRRMEPPERADRISRMPPEQARAAFEQLEAPLQEELLAHLRDAQVYRFMEDLDPDDRVRLLDQLPEPVSRALIARLSPRERRFTHKLLSFPQETAGRIMTPEYLSLDPALTAAAALDRVRREGAGVETVNALPVLGPGEQFVGLVMLSDLVMAEADRTVSELLDASVPTVGPDTDQEQVARLIQVADLLALPVVSASGRLLGLITVDDAMDVLQWEQEEDIARAGAREPLDRPYFATTLMGLTRARLLWLVLLALAGAVTVQVLNVFEPLLEQVVTLSLFIPLLIGVGGNSGAQSATTVIRAMATGEMNRGHGMQVIFRETRVGLLLGTAVALLAYFPVAFVFSFPLAATVALALTVICTGATFVGAGMPLLASRLGIDPAVVSAPVVTTIVDAGGLLLYFLIARVIMGL
ncbi:magnesium transporter [Thiohalomonas denitrificans]|uniref:magnesium transporter n=1 Tax=Thiohalomonas denitrificans TaxID=415747 RepID=UPI0026F08F0C|nr:magnesium transporter [Thiohalomonas denitrificans]